MCSRNSSAVPLQMLPSRESSDNTIHGLDEKILVSDSRVRVRCIATVRLPADIHPFLVTEVTDQFICTCVP